MLTGRKLAVTLAFTVLIALAAGVNCGKFFQPPTDSTITIDPTAPNVEQGYTTVLQAYIVNTNNQGSYATSGVSWSSSDATIATVSGTGSATLTGVGVGTATITASSESVTNTATATVYITVTSMSISPGSQSIAATATTADPFIVKANGSIDISSGATLTVYQGGTEVSTITCTYNSSAAVPGQYCSSVDASTGTYQVVATYTGTTITATATLDIT